MYLGSCSGVNGNFLETAKENYHQWSVPGPDLALGVTEGPEHSHHRALYFPLTIEFREISLFCDITTFVQNPTSYT